MYRIIHVDQDWIVCEGKIGIIKVGRKSAALRAVHDAKELLHSNEPVGRGQNRHKTAMPKDLGCRLIGEDRK